MNKVAVSWKKIKDQRLVWRKREEGKDVSRRTLIKLIQKEMNILRPTVGKKRGVEAGSKSAVENAQRQLQL